MGRTYRRAVLIAGVYGSGKSSVAAEIAYVLQRRGSGYALLDIDYLGWAGAGREDGPTEEDLRLRNVAAVASNYREAGIGTFVLAGFVRDRAQVARLQEAIGVPLRVVRLEVSLEEIERRLAADVTTERRDDLDVAAASIAASEGVGVEDLAIANDGHVPSVAGRILEWLGWS
jgi:adenylylsulfate kinase-like enzyme